MVDFSSVAPHFFGGNIAQVLYFRVVPLRVMEWAAVVFIFPVEVIFRGPQQWWLSLFVGRKEKHLQY